MGPKPSDQNRPAVVRAIASLLDALGLDRARDPDLAQTPERVADLYAEVFAGLDPANEPDLAAFPSEGEGGLVVVRDLAFHALCVHHLVPFFGRAHVAYLPGKKIVGISGPARLVDYYSRRPQLQERMTEQIAAHVERLLEPRGVAVAIEARHLCMEMRGIRRRGLVQTRVVRGALAQPPWSGALGF